MPVDNTADVSADDAVDDVFIYDAADDALVDDTVDVSVTNIVKHEKIIKKITNRIDYSFFSTNNV